MVNNFRDETSETNRPLRYGYTTGACATATSLAAARLLLIGGAPETVDIMLPRGQMVALELAYCRRHGAGAEAATVKDAGDDPDVTHGALIIARLALAPSPGVRFHAGPGVGTVTLPGLSIPVGEPAINPVPRQMMTEHLRELAKAQGYDGGFEVSIGVENGAALALSTMNPRLGISGGLSILGTTGIVRPFSCAAYIASIHQSIDVARTNGIDHIAACTGATSEQTIRGHYGLSDMALIEMGDFAGAVLKYMRKAPVEKLSLVGGFGKISKLAAGHLDLHSRKSSIDFQFLARQAQWLGADEVLRERIEGANTSQQALKIAREAGFPLGDRVCRLARAQGLKTAGGEVDIEVWALDRQGHPVGFDGGRGIDDGGD